MRRITRVLAAMSAATLWGVVPAGAQTPAAPVQVAQTPPPAIADSLLEARARQVAAELRCPVCQGLSLQDSPAELSQEMKDVVREQLRAGKSPEEVKQYFVARYGEWILLEPQAHGFNWLVYIVPVVVLLGGAAGVVVAVRRWTTRPVGESPTEGVAEDATESASL